MSERDLQREVPQKVTLEVIPGIPLIKSGDNLGAILEESLGKSNIKLRNKDTLVIAQKIVSRAEDRVVSLREYNPSRQAIEISQKSGQNPRLVQLILNESDEIRWIMDGTPDSPGIIVVKHKLGHVCSGAGIDMTNTGTEDKDSAILLPKNPDLSARTIAEYLGNKMRIQLGIMVIDTLGDRNRIGSIGKAIGVANIPARTREMGLEDLDGKKMLVADIAFADSVAGLAMLVMSNPDAATPVVLVRGLDYQISPAAKIQDVFSN